ncbi:unnamed protein product [Lactuca virosa]|uniref:Uncharacterized protein n=1 Tax=Lactuca virosa TaxID=75947 RepID=A0AAU9N8B8_9ASTR|nr:unnamed protein product [Lactuca virosa]
MNRFDNVINLYPPKRRRTTRGGDTKGRGLTVLSSQPSFDYVNPTSSLEPPSTITLHECPIIVDHKLKHGEETLPSSDVETPWFEIPPHPTSEVPTLVESLEPTPKDQPSSSLFVVATF